MIFQNFKPKSKDFYVKEIDKTITIREVTYPIRKQILEAKERKDSGAAMTLLILHSVYHDGKRVFESEKDLENLPSTLADQLFLEAAEMFNHAESDLELKKN